MRSSLSVGLAGLVASLGAGMLAPLPLVAQEAAPKGGGQGPA